MNNNLQYGSPVIERYPVWGFVSLITVQLNLLLEIKTKSLNRGPNCFSLHSKAPIHMESLGTFLSLTTEVLLCFPVASTFSARCRPCGEHSAAHPQLAPCIHASIVDETLGERLHRVVDNSGALREAEEAEEAEEQGSGMTWLRILWSTTWGRTWPFSRGTLPP